MTIRVPWDPAIHRIQTMFLMNYIVDQTGCVRTGYGLNNWINLQDGIVRMKSRNHKWDAYLNDGVCPREDQMQSLLQHCPGTAEVLNNPLWLVLHDLDPADWQALATKIRLNGHDRLGIGNDIMALLCGVPEWSRLGILLILLRTRGVRYDSYRSWLCNNFTPYFALTCLRSPCFYVRNLLFDKVSDILAGKQNDLISVRGWPINKDEFNEFLWQLDDMMDCMIVYGWSKDKGSSAFLMIWMALNSDECIEALQADDPHLHVKKIPDWFRMAVARFEKKVNVSTLFLEGLDEFRLITSRRSSARGGN